VRFATHQSHQTTAALTKMGLQDFVLFYFHLFHVMDGKPFAPHVNSVSLQPFFAFSRRFPLKKPLEPFDQIAVC